jgi:hypothetical protein
MLVDECGFDAQCAAVLVPEGSEGAEGAGGSESSLCPAGSYLARREWV